MWTIVKRSGFDISATNIHIAILCLFVACHRSEDANFHDTVYLGFGLGILA